MADNINILLTNGKDKITFPILPESFEVSDSWNNQEVNINQIGLITMIGKRGLRSLTISSFFPYNYYGYILPNSSIFERTAKRSTKDTFLQPWQGIKKLQSWRGKILTIGITGVDRMVTWPCVIDDLTYSEKDGSGDVYFTLVLKEYKKTSTKRNVATKTGKTVDKGKDISPNAMVPTKYKTKKGDTINKICKKFWGNTKKNEKVYKKNKKKIKKAFKKYLKHCNKKQKQAYKKKSKYNKELPKKTKLTLGLI